MCTHAFSQEPSKLWTPTCRFWYCLPLNASFELPERLMMRVHNFYRLIMATFPIIVRCSPLMTAFCRVIHNSLTHFLKSVHLSGGKDCNVWPTDEKRNSPRFFFFGIPDKCFMCPLLCDTTDVKPIIHFRPYPLQHVMIDFWNGSDDSSSVLVADPVVQAVERRSPNIPP